MGINILNIYLIKNNMKKISIINFCLATLIILSGIIQLYCEGEFHVYRRVKAILGYFVILPSAFFSLILTFKVLGFYLKKEKKDTYIPLYLSIPSIILLGYFFLGILVILFNLLFN